MIEIVEKNKIVCIDKNDLSFSLHEYVSGNLVKRKPNFVYGVDYKSFSNINYENQFLFEEGNYTLVIAKISSSFKLGDTSSIQILSTLCSDVLNSGGVLLNARGLALLHYKYAIPNVENIDFLGIDHPNSLQNNNNRILIPRLFYYSDSCGFDLPIGWRLDVISLESECNNIQSFLKSTRLIYLIKNS